MRGKRVGVIGTGSSGIQLIPAIAPEVAELLVFQRTPNFAVPARNAPADLQLERKVKAEYREYRERARNSVAGTHVLAELVETGEQSALEVSEEARNEFDERLWAIGGCDRFLFAYRDLWTSSEANETLAEYVRTKIRETVKNPQVAEPSCPKDHAIGTKRRCVGTNYYETFNGDNVTLVDIRSAPIAEFTAGVRLEDGRTYDLDVVVFATGFDAISGALMAIDIRGRGGISLREEWHAGPRTYLGLASAGFPNLFMITGPGSPSVLSNLPLSIEQHVEWIAEALAYMRANALTTMEATPEAQQDWMRHVSELAQETLFPQANSWFVGANIPGKPRDFTVYLGGVGTYRTLCAEIAQDEYRGFRFSGAPARSISRQGPND